MSATRTRPGGANPREHDRRNDPRHQRSISGADGRLRRCHDHKFDPITQDDYYGLYATFAGVHHGAASSPRRASTTSTRPPCKPLQDEQQRLEKRTQANWTKQSTGEAKKKRRSSKAAGRGRLSQRTGTEETFRRSQPKFVRLTVEGVDTNPQAARGIRNR